MTNGTCEHADGNPSDVPFSIVCRECDDGMHIESHDQAVAEGWTDIQYARDLPLVAKLADEALAFIYRRQQEQAAEPRQDDIHF
jgi:hypothetical protein